MSKRTRWRLGASLICAVAIGCEEPMAAVPTGRSRALETELDDAGALSDDDAGPAPHACPLLHEDFESGEFPSDWLRFDRDGQTPDFSVGFVDAAWVVTPEIPPGDTSNHAAASTSYYRDWSAADDWLVTKPLTLPATQTCALSWRARSDDSSFREDYEVRIFTSPPVPETLATDSTLLRAIAEETPTYTTHVEALTAYAGRTVYLAFRNNAFDKFLLYVDDVTVSCD